MTTLIIIFQKNMLVLPRALGIIISHGIRLSLNDCQHLYVTLVGCIRVEIY